MFVARSTSWMLVLIVFGGTVGARVWAETSPADDAASSPGAEDHPAKGSCDCSVDMPGCTCVHCQGKSAVCPCEENEKPFGFDFGVTRAYVAEEGEVELEYWLIPEFPRGGGDTEVETRYEVEFGLPHRFELALYAVTHQGGNQGPLELDEQKIETRWAFADWGSLFANPTLYLEWEAVNRAPDHIEGKVLFAGQVAPRWNAALNLVFEHEMGGEQENEHEVAAAVSYVVVDQKFSIGAEAKVAFVNTREDRGDVTTEALLGPNLQFQLLPRMHLGVSPLFGLNDDSPRAKVVIVMGWEF